MSKSQLSLVLLLPGLIVASSVLAHPYKDAPVATPKKFILHQTNDGRPIFTNIPKRCFADGRLICHQLHPVFEGPGTIDKPEG